MKRFVRFSLRVLIVVSLLAAIADLPVPSPRAPRSRAYAIDASGSVGSMAARDALRAFEHDRRRLAANDRAFFVAFSDRPLPFVHEMPQLARDATDLGAAVEAAAALAGDRGEVVLATDGRDTAGRLDSALLAAAARGIPVHVLPIGPVDTTDVRIAEVDAPASVPSGVHYELRVTLEANAPIAGKLNGIDFAFMAPGRQVVVVRDATRLKLNVADACPENDAADVSVLVRTDRPRVRAPAHLAKLLPSDWTVATAGRAEEFDAVIVDALEADVAGAVRTHGVGLIALGGSRAYAPGGWSGTPLEEVLPLWAFPEERSTIVFVLDRSGSMGDVPPGSGRRRIDIAAAAVEGALSLVAPDDTWALVTFADDATIDVPPRQGGARLPRIRPEGGTRILPALELALAQAGAAPSGKRRIVLVTDGETQETDLAAMGRRLSERGVALVAIGTSPDGLRPLAQLGGTLVPAHDFAKLADVLRDALARNRELTVDNARVEPRDHPLVAGLPAWPALRINRTSAKRTAEVVAAAGDHPVVAVGIAGRGRVAALTLASEEGWMPAWPGLPTLLARLVEHVAPPAPGVAAASSRLEGDEIVFSIRRPGGGDAIDAHPVPLLRRGADLYEGRAPAVPGTTVLRIAGRAVAAFTLPHPREYSALGPDAPSIRRIAALTGGRVLSRLEDLESLPPREARGTRPGRDTYLVVALAAFLVEIALGVFWR
jgi:hypothetical protein